jgi:hypothetical protein
VAAPGDGGGAHPSLMGAVGYRLNRVIGFEVGMTWMKLVAATPNDVTACSSPTALADLTVFDRDDEDLCSSPRSEA